MRVLVTGGAGYIGSHTAKALAVAGHEPMVLDDLSAGHEWAVKWGPLEVGSIVDAGSVSAAFDRYRPEAVVHFAAHAYVGESMHHPAKYFRTNLVGTLNVLDRVLAMGPVPFVFSSTCATYGIPESVPIPESTPQRPVNPYGEAKLAVERVLRWYGEIHSLPWIALRYFNAAGADPDGELGEVHDPETHLVPRAIAAALGRDRLEIFGTDYPTSDGTAIRDYVHVSDLADAHLRALDHLVGGGPSTALNLGTGSGHTVREVIDAVGRASGMDVPAIESARRPGDPPALVADASPAHELLGWTPHLSDLETIVETAWNWHTRPETG